MKFFRKLAVKKTNLPPQAERLSCLHIQCVAYEYAICKEKRNECLWIKSLFAPNFLGYRGKIKGLETIFGLNSSEQKFIPHENKVNKLLLTGNI